MIKLQGTRKGRNAPKPHACPRRSLPSRRKINDLVNQDQRSCEGRKVPLLEFLAFGSHFIGNFSFLGTSPLLTKRPLSVLFGHHEDIIPRHHGDITEFLTETSRRRHHRVVAPGPSSETSQEGHIQASQDSARGVRTKRGSRMRTFRQHVQDFTKSGLESGPEPDLAAVTEVLLHDPRDELPRERDQCTSQ